MLIFDPFLFKNHFIDNIDEVEIIKIEINYFKQSYNLNIRKFFQYSISP